MATRMSVSDFEWLVMMCREISTLCSGFVAVAQHRLAPVKCMQWNVADAVLDCVDDDDNEEHKKITAIVTSQVCRYNRWEELRAF